ncbi:MAG: hypothetical protein IKB28_08690 [Clostridia bacterium]|nr:hypothetical protein [Clostridia bacterium]
MIKRLKLLPIVLLVFVLAASSFSIIASATTQTLLDGKVTVNDTLNKNELDGGTVTIKAKGSGLFGGSPETNTVTITNTSGSKAYISFSYSASQYDTLTVDGTSSSEDSGTVKKMLDANGTITIVLKSAKGLSSKTATLVLSDFDLEKAEENVIATIAFDASKGSVNANNVAASNGTSVTLTNNELPVAAVAASGCRFLCWINTDNKILSTSANDTLQVTKSTTVNAVFVRSSSDTLYFRVGEYLWEGLDTAITKAGDSGTIILMNNGTLPAGNYTIPSGVTLLIPYDAAGTVALATPPILNSDATPTAFRTLTLANGANITVNGAMSVAGSVSEKMGTNGQPTGAVGFVKMNSGSSITVNNKATLYVWGYVMGSGSVVIESGGAVYECFQAEDYRGGSATSDMASGGKNEVFPMSQYYIQNVEVPMTMKAGSREYCFFAANVSGSTQTATIPFIGSNAMFNMTSGYLIKDYDENTDRLIVDVYGDLSFSPYSFKVAVTINTDNFVLPITPNLTVNINRGTTTLSQDIALLPEAQLNIAEGATCILTQGVRLIVYDIDNWGAYCGSKNARMAPLNYAPGRRTGVSRTDLTKDASLLVNGTLNASKGYIYTTAGGANICSSTSGTIIVGSAGTETNTYQVTQTAEPGLFGSTTQKITTNAITITPAKLKNADGSYFEKTAKVTAKHTFVYKDGAWGCEEHSIDNGGNGVATKEPSCTEPGITTKTCTVCGHKETEEIPVVDHDYKEEEWKVDNDNKWHWHICNLCDQEVDKAEHFDEDTDLKCDACGAGVACEHPDKETKEENVVEATCTVGGSYDLVTYCTVCKEKTKTEKRTTPTIAHSLTKTEAVEATCSKPGNNAYWTCTACGKYFSNSAGTDIYKIEENEWVTTVPHTPGAEATCTTAQTCTVCGATVVEALDHDYSEQFTTDKEATCTEAGSKSRHCSRCDSTTEVTEIPAIQHDWEVSYSANDDATECTASGVCRNNPEHTVSATVEIKATVKDAATCTEDGTTIYTADFTGYDWAESQSTDVTVEKLGHIDKDLNLHCDRCTAKLDCEHEKTESIPAVEATCTETGLTEGKKCSVCGEVLEAQEVIPVAGHTEEAVPGKAATCTETGLTEGKKCSVCGEVLVKQEVVDALGHNLVNDICQNCGEITYTVIFMSPDGQQIGEPLKLKVGEQISLPEDRFTCNISSDYFTMGQVWLLSDGRTEIEQGSILSKAWFTEDSTTITITAGFLPSELKVGTIQFGVEYGGANSADGANSTLMTITFFAYSDVPGLQPTFNGDYGKEMKLTDNLFVYAWSRELTRDDLADDGQVSIKFSNATEKIVEDMMGSYVSSLEKAPGITSETLNNYRALRETAFQYGLAVKDYFDGENWLGTNSFVKVEGINNELKSTDTDHNTGSATIRIDSFVVEFEDTYTLKYNCIVDNLPAGSKIVRVGAFVTDTAINTTQQPTSFEVDYYGCEISESAESNGLYGIEHEVNAAELGDRFVVAYIEYEFEGATYYAFSDTFTYGITTYLQRQIYKYNPEININAELLPREDGESEAQQELRTQKYVRMLINLLEVAKVVEDLPQNP